MQEEVPHLLSSVYQLSVQLQCLASDISFLQKQKPEYVTASMMHHTFFLDMTWYTAILICHNEELGQNCLVCFS